MTQQKSPDYLVTKLAMLFLLGAFPSIKDWLVHYSGAINQTPIVNSTKIFESLLGPA